MDAKDFAAWGWRIPFLVSILLLIFSVYIRLQAERVAGLREDEGRRATARKAPLTDSFLRYPNNKYVLLALLGATAGQGVVWYTGQFYALFFLTHHAASSTTPTAYTLIAVSLLLGTPFFIFFGWLSDRIGRLKIILAGCLIAAVTLLPAVPGADPLRQPGAGGVLGDRPPISVTGQRLQLPPVRRSVEPSSPTATAPRTSSTKQGLSFKPWSPGRRARRVESARIGDKSPSRAGASRRLRRGAEGVRLSGRAGHARTINYPMTLLILFVMVLYVTMVYGPIAAFLVELFPTPIRYTSMSLPYHIGNGWFGGMLPLIATAMVAATGDIYYGLWYPIVVAAMTLVIGALFLRETLGTKIH